MGVSRLITGLPRRARRSSRRRGHGHSTAPLRSARHSSPLQYAEGLTDRQAAQMMLRAIAWKYCLGLELVDTGSTSQC